MKRIFKLLLCIFSISFLFYMPSNLEAKTLREMKDELATTKANKSAIEAARKEAQNKINRFNSDISAATQGIEKCEDDIEASRKKIAELEVEIVEKNKEIENLLRFLQISGGENAYLEYIFGATSFADFIYRTTVIEQLSNYNDNLIKEMDQMIEDNKNLQVELADKIKNLEGQIVIFESKLKSLNLSIEDLDEDQKDLAAEIKATEAEISYYEEFGCKLDEEISDCIDVPYAVGFTRPTIRGYISSNFGYRYVFGRTSYHSGIDIALSEGNNVYASAAGYVSKKVVRATCGGNIIYVQHNIKGVKYTTAYMHLLSFNVSVGDIVTLNTVIGKSGGSSTRSYDSCTTGAHLHFGILKGWTTSSSKAMNPRDYVNFPAKYSSYYSRW